MLKWFLSSTVREASAMYKHVRKLLSHQRDILSPQAVGAVEVSLGSLKEALANADKATLQTRMQDLEKVATKWIRPYPNAAWRENFEVLLVALAVAMSIRTFFLQPFKIPTGSMQPTLFGVNSDNLLNQKEFKDFKIPTGLERVREWFAGISYVHVVADEDGILQQITEPTRILIFNIKQTVWVGGRSYTIWFPPDYGAVPLIRRAELEPGRPFKKGEDIVKVRVQAGDHLFVDRLTYNLRPPNRGEIVVFETKGIDRLPQDQFYIKRLVGLGGEEVRIGDDRHLIINGKRLDAATPHFEKVYSFNPAQPPHDSRYSGHVNDKVAEPYHPAWQGPLAPNFPDSNTTYKIDPGYLMVMGDNTMNSFDSRGWGEFSSTNVIGKSWFVYWPISDRFGWGYHR
jgi:signal peptidase I